MTVALKRMEVKRTDTGWYAVFMGEYLEDGTPDLVLELVRRVAIVRKAAKEAEKMKSPMRRAKRLKKINICLN